MNNYKIFIETPIKSSEPISEYCERLAGKLAKSGEIKSPRTIERWYFDFKKTPLFEKFNSLAKELNVGIPVSKMIEKPKILFYDIEVSPCMGFFWRPGYNLTITPESIIQESAIICISYKWQGDNKVHSLKWNNGDDKKLLEDFYKIVSKADIICGHNNKSFDDKWIRTRALFHRIAMPNKFNSIDTYRMAKSGFRFNSNKLDYISKFTGSSGKISTSYDMWKKIVLNNDKQSLADMIKYCEQDVLELENTYNVLQEYSPIKKFRRVL